MIHRILIDLDKQITDENLEKMINFCNLIKGGFHININTNNKVIAIYMENMTTSILEALEITLTNLPYVNSYQIVDLAPANVLTNALNSAKEDIMGHINVCVTAQKEQEIQHVIRSYLQSKIRTKLSEIHI